MRPFATAQLESDRGSRYAAEAIVDDLMRNRMEPRRASIFGITAGLSLAERAPAAPVAR